MADRLTMYFTSDTHGYVFPTNFISPAQSAMGLLSMRFPKDGNTLVIDGGDTLQGSPLTYYCYSNHLPMPVAAVMNDLAYDYVTLGNHDFNYGYDTMRAHLKGLDAHCLCANVQDTTNTMPIDSYTIHVLENGLRVGIIGAVTDWVNRWEKPENLGALMVKDPYPAIAKAVEALRDKVDVLIGIYHGGFEKELTTGRVLSSTGENIACKLCEDFPFDILLTGHQHMTVANTVYHGTHVVQTPSNATAYARVVMDERGSISSALIVPDITPSMKPWQSKLYAELQQWLDAPIGHLTHALRPQDKLTMALQGTAIARLFNMVQMEATGAQVSCTSLGNEVRGFDKVVTVRDVVASYVYANTLVVLRVTGKQLKAALEQCARYFEVDPEGKISIASAFRLPKEAHYNYDYFSGIRYTMDLRKPMGERVTNVTYRGEPVGEAESLTLVMNHYRATGAGDFDVYMACDRVAENLTEVSELLLNYLRGHDCIDVPQANDYVVILPDGTRA